MENKVCNKCGIEKDKKMFYKDKRLTDGLNSSCKDCINLYKREKYSKNKVEFNKKRYEKNKEKLKEKSKKYRKENKDSLNKKRTEYNNKNREKINKRRRENWAKNRESVNKKRKEEYNKNKKTINAKRNKNTQQKKKIDEIFKAKLSIRAAISYSLRKNEIKKSNKTEQILGCTFMEFKKYLESKFEPWMNWENYGKYNGELNYGWDIDHIIPTSSAKTKEEVVRMNHYTNLQPLCSKVNRDIKRDN